MLKSQGKVEKMEQKSEKLKESDLTLDADLLMFVKQKRDKIN